MSGASVVGGGRAEPGSRRHHHRHPVQTISATSSAAAWSCALPFATLRASYAYGFESDYRSNAITDGRASAELFERNTAFDISYGRGFDLVCNLAQPDNQEAVERRPLDGSEGCFSERSDAGRASTSTCTPCRVPGPRPGCRCSPPSSR